MGPEQNFAPEGQRPITVVLVDDEHLIRAALARALSDGGIELVGEAANGADAIATVVDVRPDVVLMDLRLPGFPASRRSSSSACSRPPHAYWCSPAQNTTAWSKQSSPAPAATSSRPRRRRNHQRRPSHRRWGIGALPQIAGKLLQRIRELTSPSRRAGNTAIAIRAALTERELEIFTQLASGNSNHQIAHDLSLSTNTVANHIASILAKLHLENRIQAAVQAVCSGNHDREIDPASSRSRRR